VTGYAQPHCPPLPCFLGSHDESKGGRRCPWRRGRWLSVAVKGRHGCQRPPKQERRRAGNAKTGG